MVQQSSIQPNTFYRTVSGWVRTYRNPDSLENLKNYVDASAQPADIKEQLYREIDYKVKQLKAMPLFVKKGDLFYLADDNGEIRLFPKRFTAICKMCELVLKGYDVHLSEQAAGYYIINAE